MLVGFPEADAIAAAIVALIVISISIQLGRRTIDGLLDRVPEGVQRTVSVEDIGALLSTPLDLDAETWGIAVLAVQANGGEVTTVVLGDISTSGANAIGVMATSIGGSGGSAATTVDASAGLGTVGVGVGGSGSGGGDGGAVARYGKSDLPGEHRPAFERAAAAGVAAKIQVLLKDMHTLTKDDGPFDLVWAEGCLFVMGFREGLATCHSLLPPGGGLAVSEVSWMSMAAALEPISLCTRNGTAEG